MSNCLLAQKASKLSAQYVMAKDKAAWLELFAEDAVIQDPVGKSPLDPSGEGHRGLEAISQFWDAVIAPGNLEMDVQASHPCGDECANVVKLSNHLPGGIVIKTDMVAVYRSSDEGKLVSLKAYWEYAKVQQQLKQLTELMPNTAN